MKKSSHLPGSINKPEENDSSCNSPGCCPGGITRRNFFGKVSLAAAGSIFVPRMIMAGPFGSQDFKHLVPADKKLNPAWVKSLFERGAPEVYRGEELRYIGMPIGGICAGQLYLGGDGKLWHWDIFNKISGTGDAHYAKPLLPSYQLEQGFALIIGDRTIPLDVKGFSDVSFRGEYPIGTVTYKDSEVPLEVRMEAFSPFIPLDTNDSSLPATIFQFTIHNTSNSPVEAVLAGSLENGVCLNHSSRFQGLRQNHIRQETGFSFLECSVKKNDDSS